MLQLLGKAEVELKKRKKKLTLESKLQECEEKKTRLSMEISQLELEIEQLKKICKSIVCSSFKP